MKKWVVAFRLRTLPLALSSVGMGGFLAAYHGTFRVEIFLLTALTTILLQILSNLANDYGDSVHGADHDGRKGPLRAVQSGSISPAAMRTAVIIAAILSFISGLVLLIVSFGKEWLTALGWLVIGCMCIYAAITYTAGRKPYGYLGLGDLSVFIFFGLVGVIGSQFMHTHDIRFSYFFPAAANGLWAVAVLNLNNIRDIESDQIAGKYSVPVRIGHAASIVYHRFLIYGAIVMGILFEITEASLHSYGMRPHRFLFLIVLPLIFILDKAVSTKKPDELDPWLKKTALTSLAFMLLFGLGLLLTETS